MILGTLSFVFLQIVDEWISMSRGILNVLRFSNTTNVSNKPDVTRAPSFGPVCDMDLFRSKIHGSRPARGIVLQVDWVPNAS